MPLFFIISGIFYKPLNFAAQFKKDVNRLLHPYLFICSVQIILTTCHSIYAFHHIIFHWELFYDCNSPSWFLLALLIGRLIFSIIINLCPKWHLVASFTISTLSLLLTSQLEIPPFLAITSATGNLIFISIGYYTKEHEIISKMHRHKYLFFISALIIWLVSSIKGQTDAHLNIYKLWVIDYLGACGGSYIFLITSQFLEKKTQLCKHFLERFGYYSLVIMSFHAIEFQLPQWFQILFFTKGPYLLIAILLCRILIAEISIYITIKNNYLRKIFKIRIEPAAI